MPFFVNGKQYLANSEIERVDPKKIIRSLFFIHGFRFFQEIQILRKEGSWINIEICDQAEVTCLTTSSAIFSWIPMSNWLVNPTHEQLISPKTNLSFPFSSVSKIKSAVQIKGTSFSSKAFLIIGRVPKKKSTKLFHLSGESYVYLAPEKRVAEKASSESAGFLWTTKIGWGPTIRTLTYPSLILAKNLMSTNIPLSPTMYFSQKSMNYPNCLCSTWLS